MTKQELIKAVANRNGISQKQAENTIDTFIEVVKEAVSMGEPIYIRGFGAFKLTTRKAKPCRDIGRNETIIVPEHQVPTFKAYPDFKFKQNHIFF